MRGVEALYGARRIDAQATCKVSELVRDVHDERAPRVHRFATLRELRVVAGGEPLVDRVESREESLPRVCVLLVQAEHVGRARDVGADLLEVSQQARAVLGDLPSDLGLVDELGCGDAVEQTGSLCLDRRPRSGVCEIGEDVGPLGAWWCSAGQERGDEEQAGVRGSPHALMRTEATRCGTDEGRLRGHGDVYHASGGLQKRRGTWHGPRAVGGARKTRCLRCPKSAAIGLLAFLGALAGCTRSLGVLGVVGPTADGVAVKMLRPGVETRVCQSSVLGLATGRNRPTIDASVAKLLALDPEADVVMNAEVVWETFVSGLFNRRCIVVRGDVARQVPVLRIPGDASHGGHH